MKLEGLSVQNNEQVNLLLSLASSDYGMSLSVSPFPPAGLGEPHLLLRGLLIPTNTLKPLQVSLF